jgi:hypothetical protein
MTSVFHSVLPSSNHQIERSSGANSVTETTARRDLSGGQPIEDSRTPNRFQRFFGKDARQAGPQEAGSCW